MPELTYTQKYSIHLLNFTLETFITYRNELLLDSNFQRDYVWSQEQKESFIDYLLSGLAFPTIYAGANENLEWGRIIDGKQRLSAVYDFVDGKLSKKYTDFDKRSKVRFGHILVNTAVLDLSEKEIVEFYILLNSAGIRHSIEDIEKAQEILKTL